MENLLIPSKAQVAGTTVLITRAAPCGTPTRPQNKICGIKIKGTMLVAISDVFTIAETKSPKAMPTIAVIRTIASCGMERRGVCI